MTRTVLLIGDTVSVIVGERFLPNGRGIPIELPNRRNGQILEWNQYGHAEVLWPNGEQYSYEAALLVHTPGAYALMLEGDDK
jgi:hypothetical protein